MAIIYNIEDYQTKQTPEKQFSKLLRELGKWTSPEEQDDYYRQLAIENEADMKAMFTK